MKVYLLSTYEEYGAENVQATLDPAKLPAMIAAHYDDWALAVPHLVELRDEAIAALAKLVHEGLPDTAATDGIALHEGWGGMQLHIVELQ